MTMFRTEYYYFINSQYQIRDAKYIHNISVISHDGQILRFISSGPYLINKAYLKGQQH